MSDVQILTVNSGDSGIRLDRWFKRHFPAVGHGLLEKWLRAGNVRVDGKKAKSGQRLEEGQSIRVPPLPQSSPDTAPAAPVLDAKTTKMLQDAVLFRDDHVIALNKPAGLAVQGGTGMADRHLDAWLDALRFDFSERPRLVHRLDKDTSGVLLLGRTAEATARLAAAFRSRDARKCYWALVAGLPQHRQGRIDAPLSKMGGKGAEKVSVDEEDGKRAVTYYRVVDNALKKASWLEMEPRTGRTHQLRAHCLLLGTPILGDGKYGGRDAMIEGTGVSRKLHLHARALRIPHPKTGRLLELMAPLPLHMASSMAFFGFTESEAGQPFTAFDVEEE